MERHVGEYKEAGMNLYDGEDRYRAEIFLPAELRNGFKFAVRENSLEISIARKESINKNNKIVEFFYNSTSESYFNETIPLREKVLVDNVKSEYKDNILEIIIPKSRGCQ